MSGSRGIDVNDPRGRLTVPPKAIGLPFRHGIDAVTDWVHEETVRVTNRDGTFDEVYPSKRCGTINRWRTNFASTGNVNWLIRADLGNGLLPNERWTEETIGNNPTMAAAGNQPESSALVNAIPSPVEWFRIQRFGDSAIFEGCTIPLDFDSFGFEIAGNDRGGDEDNLLIWINCRQFQRVEINWRGLPHVHLVQHWFYCPVEWRDAPHSNTARFSAGSGFDLVDYFGTISAQFYDPATRTSVVPGAEWTGSNNQTWQMDRPTNSMNLSGTITRTDPYPWSTKASAVIFKGDIGGAVPFDVAALWPMERDARGNTQNTRCNVIKFRNAPFVVSEDPRPANLQHLFIHMSSGHRRAGWIGHQFWLTHGDQDVAISGRIDTLYRNGVLDLPVPFTVPQEVIARMNPDYDNRFGPQHEQ